MPHEVLPKSLIELCKKLYFPCQDLATIEVITRYWIQRTHEARPMTGYFLNKDFDLLSELITT
jgi:hypothetical protein